MIIQADARHLPIKADSVQCVVTSPPFWGLRDYGTATWQGGSAECDHRQDTAHQKQGATSQRAGRSNAEAQRNDNFRDECGKCGAVRVDRQLGLEKTPDEYVANLVQVFREVWRVLRDDGTVWLNLGDSYNNFRVSMNGQTVHGGELRDKFPGRRKVDHHLKEKDLVGIPWRVAFALQADGWYLRSDIIWAKPNPMPESVTDRPTKSHEYVFLLTKSARYYWDADAVKEPATHAGKVVTLGEKSLSRGQANGRGIPAHGNGKADSVVVADGRNIRSVWTIATQSFSGAHFATFPEKLVEPCIKAGSRGPGKRCDCAELIASPTGSGPIDDPTLTTGRAGMNRSRRDNEGTRPVTRREQREWAAQIRVSPHRDEMEAQAGSEAFAHYVRTDPTGARPPRPDLLREWLAREWLVGTTPCTCPEHPGDLVLDPFAGSGTVGRVALRYNRRFVGTDLNPAYLQMARRRTGNLQPRLTW